MIFFPTLMFTKPLHSCYITSKIPKSFISSSHSLPRFQHLESAKLTNARHYTIARSSWSQMITAGEKMVALPA